MPARERQKQRRKDSFLSELEFECHGGNGTMRCHIWPLTPTSWRQTRVPSTSDVSSAWCTSTNARHVRVDLRDDSTSTRELTKTSAHRNLLWYTSSWEELSGPMRKWTARCERDGPVVGGETGVPTMLRFHKVGTTPQDKDCHQGGLGTGRHSVKAHCRIHANPRA